MKPLRMHQPPHPGEILRELCLAPFELSVTEAADSLGVSRNTLSAILNGRAGISPETHQPSSLLLALLQSAREAQQFLAWRPALQGHLVDEPPREFGSGVCSAGSVEAARRDVGRVMHETHPAGEAFQQPG